MDGTGRRENLMSVNEKTKRVLVIKECATSMKQVRITLKLITGLLEESGMSRSAERVRDLREQIWSLEDDLWDLFEDYTGETTYSVAEPIKALEQEGNSRKTNSQ